uniref:Uncharacterized protein n=1 Tax=Arundo donax TaxID=35708 RepID=A0A0A8ZSW2_ARUDO
MLMRNRSSKLCLPTYHVAYRVNNLD